MSCLLKEEEGKMYAVLGFQRDQLLYDINNASYIEGSVMETGNHHNRHMVQDVGEDGNVDRVTRILDLTVAQSREMLYPYTKHHIHRAELNDRFNEQMVYGIVLKLPSDFSQTTLNLLEQLIHELLVCKAVAEWMRLTNPARSQSWQEKANEAVSEIRTSLTSRMTRTRIRQHWI